MLETLPYVPLVDDLAATLQNSVTVVNKKNVNEFDKAPDALWAVVYADMA